MAEFEGQLDLPRAAVVAKRKGRVSVVWLIPLLAAVVAVGIAIQRILSEGPTITIVFGAAQGIEAGKTNIKYKDVSIGQVTAVQLSEDFSKVQVTAQMAKSAAGLMVEDAKFWVVQPQITLSGVSGLGTLLSGNYIGFEAGASKQKRRAFEALAVPPVVTSEQPGRRFVLRADTLGSLAVGSPIYYRRLQAGQVMEYQLVDGGRAVEVKVFINAPYDRYVTPETRFWNASGFDVSVGAGGVDVRTESLVALLAGGIAFETPAFAPKGEAAAADTVFTLYGDQTTAMKQPESLSARYVLYFDEALRGLSVGAPVTLLGIQGGAVTDVGLDFNPKTLDLRGRVEVVAYPERLVERFTPAQAAEVEKTTEALLKQRRALIQKLIEERGLRAQLRSGNLLTGQLYVAFEYFPNAPKVKVDWAREPIVLPTVPSTLPDVEAKIMSILAKLDKLPYEAIGQDAKKVLVTLEQTLKSLDKTINRLDREVTPELKQVLEEVRRATAAASQVLQNADATLIGRDAPAQQELRDALQEVTRAARALRVLSDYLEQHPEALLRGKETP
jgi:paraquat-inducible protein B